MDLSKIKVEAEEIEKFLSTPDAYAHPDFAVRDHFRRPGPAVVGDLPRLPALCRTVSAVRLRDGKEISEDEYPRTDHVI